jgi:hypothetical protein
LDPAESEQILLNSGGCGEQSMLHVEAKVYQIIAHRRESNEVDIDFLYELMQYEPKASRAPGEAPRVLYVLAFVDWNTVLPSYGLGSCVPTRAQGNSAKRVDQVPELFPPRLARISLFFKYDAASHFSLFEAGSAALIIVKVRETSMFES